MHQVGTSSLLIYMMHGHTYINFVCIVELGYNVMKGNEYSLSL